MAARYRKAGARDQLSPLTYAARAVRRAGGLAGAPSADADAQVLELGVVQNAVFRALAADTGLLDTPERRYLGGNDAGIEADDAGLQCLGDPPGACEVARVEVRGEAELGVIGHADGIGFRLEAQQRRHGPESLLASHQHAGLDVGDHGRLEERAA